MFIIFSLIMGVLLGLLASGGSMLAMPIFRYGLQQPTELAIPCALFVICLTSVVAMVMYAQEKLVQWREGLLFVLVSAPSAGFAGWIAHSIAEGLKLLLFALFVVFAAWRVLRGREERPLNEHWDLTKWRALISAMLLIGFLSGLLGVAGGTLIIPVIMVMKKMPVSSASGTSLLVISANALAAFVGHTWHVDLPWKELGQVTALTVLGSLAGFQLAGDIANWWIKNLLGYTIIGLAGFVIWKETMQ